MDDELGRAAKCAYANASNVGIRDREECQGLSPLGLFSLFFTDYLLREMVTETNRYAQQRMVAAQ